MQNIENNLDLQAAATPVTALVVPSDGIGSLGEKEVRDRAILLSGLGELNLSSESLVR